MGKLTGPSSKPIATSDPITPGTNSNDTNSNNIEAATTPKTPAEIVADSNNTASNNTTNDKKNDHPTRRLSFTKRLKSRHTRTSSSGGGTANNSNNATNNSSINKISNSMVVAVNNAAQTARLVLESPGLIDTDQLDLRNSDSLGGGSSSHGIRRSDSLGRDSNHGTNSSSQGGNGSLRNSLSNTSEYSIPLMGDDGDGILSSPDNHNTDRRNELSDDIMNSLQSKFSDVTSDNGSMGMRQEGLLKSNSNIRNNDDGVESDDDFIRPSRSNSDVGIKKSRSGSALYSSSTTPQRSSTAPVATNEEWNLEVPPSAPEVDQSFHSPPPAFAGPPMNAFQNLPMTRNGLFSHIVSAGNTSNSNTNTNNNSSNNNNNTSTDEEEITSPQGIEVTNHFDAAAAISAALSRSHLADATGTHQYNMNHHTTLQLHNPWGNTPTATNMPMGTMPKPVRRKNSKGAAGGGDNVYRKSFSGGSDEKRSGIPKPRRARRSSTDNEGVDYYNANESKSSKRERKRGSSFDIGEVVMTNFDSKTTLKDTADQIDTSQRRRRTLPTPEEAAAEMLVNRTSFVSADELSFGSDSDANDLEKLLLGRSTSKKKKKNDEWEEENEFMNDLEIILKKKQKESGRGDVNKSEVDKAGDKKDEEDDAKKASDISIGSVSACSNESNTSSFVYGNSNANSSFTSEMSPISMSSDSKQNSTEGGRGANNINIGNSSNNNVKSTNKKGMLGNLANTRRATLGLGESAGDNSYDVADDEYSTNSEASPITLPRHTTKKIAPSAATEKKNTSDNIQSKVVPKPSNSHGLFDQSSSASVISAETNDETMSVLATASKDAADGEYMAPSAPISSTVYKNGDDQQQAHVLTKIPQSCQSISSADYAPPHRVSLFDSFDRNWEQAVMTACSNKQQQSLGSSIGSNNSSTFHDCRSYESDKQQFPSQSLDVGKVLDLGKKCFAAFAIVFGPCSLNALDTNETKSIVGGEEKSPPFQWWVDDHALTTGDRKDCEQTPVHQEIPIVIIRSLWKTCFFDTEEEEDTDAILDLIEHILVKDLCYLEKGPASNSSTVSCLRISLDVYAEFGWYIVRRYGMEDELAGWHYKFAVLLRRLLLSGGGTRSDFDRESFIIRRYAAQSLPRHTAIGLIGVESNGNFQKLDVSAIKDDIKLTELRTHLFENLLCHKGYIKARIELLGRGNTRPGDLDKSLDADDSVDAHCITLAKQHRDNDSNLLAVATRHVKDIEWCSSFCRISDGKDSDEETTEQQEEDEDTDDSSSPLPFFLDAVDQLKEELHETYQQLYDSGKLTICDDDTVKEDSTNGPSQSKEEDNGQSSIEESCIEVAKMLLEKDDAWTMKDDSKQLFKEDPTVEISSPRPPRKGRKKKDVVPTTPLARVLNIDINDLRTAVSIGRSLLALAEFSRVLPGKEASKEVAKDLSSRLQGIQCSCLMAAIEILSCSATTLGYILCNTLQNFDEDDVDSTSGGGPFAILQTFAMTREASKPLLSIAGILSVDAWFALGRLVNKVCTRDDMLIYSLERSLLILNSPKSTFLAKAAGLDTGISEFTLLSPLMQYKCFLQSNINNSVGVYLYEQGDFERGGEYLDKALTFRREMLEKVRGQGNLYAAQGVDTSELFLSTFGGATKSNFLVSSAPMSREVFENISVYSITHSCTLIPRAAFKIDELELSLSLTLEYSALTHHADQKYQLALSLFQESLILRTIHVGKHSLDVASLHFNMGVVYDDLEQYQQAISRYHESLRIRLEQKGKATSPSVISELEDSILLTLKCMGQVYKLLDDIDNAICCYVKALEMVNKKFQTYQQPACEWTKMGTRLGVAVPVPTITIIFDEMRTSTGSSNWKTHFQTMNKKELCHMFEPRLHKRRSRSTISRLKRELVKIHLTVIDLVNERKQAIWDRDNDSGSQSTSKSRSKLPGLSLLLASLSSSFKNGRDDAFEAALMRSSFSLGRIRLEETRYEEAADHLETALRSKWVLDPASSSDSDSTSDFSRKSTISSRKQMTKGKSMDEDDPEEGQIYYALGITNAALDDHERAVRCFLTSLRYLRRSLRKVDSLEVARVLFDCATSYYYLCNFDQSISLYDECLRILKSHDLPAKVGNDEMKPPSTDETPQSIAFRRGIVLYSLVLSKSAIEFDSEASNLLNEAQTLLSSCNDSITLAYLEFLTGLFLYHAASQVPFRLRSITRISQNGLSLNDGLSWNEMCQSALNLFEHVKNECWFDPTDGVEDSEEVRHLPLSGHICFKKGQVYELMGSVDQALNSYVDAANFYRIACGDENMYVASVLHRMGIISSQKTEYHSIGYFNEALSIRKNLLGSNDHLVAETLYASAAVLAKLNRYEASMERYHEALRIQMNDSQDSNEVATTLSGMGICHYDHQAYDLALTCLEGAVKIRKYRVSRLTDSSELVELYGEEVALGTEFFNLGNIHMQMGDYAQAMQCFVQSRDLRWCHVGSGTVDKILDKYYTEGTVDEDELLGLAHCLHNIGVMFDLKKEYQRSLPHYEEALAIKNAISGFSAQDSMSLVDQAKPGDNRALVFQSLYEDYEFPRCNKATLSASHTRQKIAMVYVKRKMYDHALFHFSHSLRIQRQVLGKDHFRVGSILSSMGNALRRTSTHSETAIICYNESLRISKLRFGENHATVASAMYQMGSLYDSNKNFSKAMHYYQRALSVYKRRYSQDLRQRLCSGMDRPRSVMMNGDDNVGTEILSTGDEVYVTSDCGPHPEIQIREQYALVTEALRKAKLQDALNRGERISCVGDSHDAWMTFEALLFRFVEMLSVYIVDPASQMMRDAVDTTRQRIESVAHDAIINASDSIDYNFLLLMQEK